MNDKKTVELPLQDAARLLRILEEVVVSLDQLGSSSRDPLKVAVATQEYLNEGRAARRLAKARGIVIDSFDRKFTEEELDRLLGKVTYWNDVHYRDAKYSSDDQF